MTADPIAPEGRAEYWAPRIAAAWQKSVEGILETATSLAEAKARVSATYGEWGRLISMLPFGRRQADLLIDIAPHVEKLWIHGSKLPASWRTIREITRLPDYLSLIESGSITSELERSQVSAWLKSGRQETVAEEIAEFNGGTVADLAGIPLKCGTIYADPPWDYGNQSTRGANQDHYTGLTVDEICALPVRDIVADRAHLHLWTTNAFLFDAKCVIEAWGFEYKSCYVWVKPQMGMGNYWRVSHEFLLLGVRGGLTFSDKSLMSWGEFARGDHSAKPEQIRALIERASPAPRLEMFARRTAPGWLAWGNQISPSLFNFEASFEAA